jgi:serine/threonine protein kinase/Flp pilus assembly protein TadD
MWKVNVAQNRASRPAPPLASCQPGSAPLAVRLACQESPASSPAERSSGKLSLESELQKNPLLATLWSIPMALPTFSHYTVLSKVGAGGMGEVYLASDSRLERKIALKILPAELVQSEDRLLRFVQEARAASSLNHPNILTIHEIGTEDGTHYIASEYVEGETLRSRIERGPLDLAAVIDICGQIAAALQVAHENGIVHRDIKPENVMLRKDGLVKVLDFGLAKLVGAASVISPAESATALRGLTAAGMILGTAAYMSPEQARGVDVDSRSDLFSLGVVIYEMTAGVAPFHGTTLADLLIALVEKEPQPLRLLRRDVPAALAAVVDRCLAKQPERRYATAKALLDDLKGITAESMLQVAREEKPSIAVLPFTNMSADPENEYFCDGLAEELLHALAKVERLKVAGRTSTFMFKGRHASLPEIAAALNVGAIVDGSVRKAGDRLRITVQLVNASDGTPLWSERYDTEMRDIFEVQDEIAIAVVEALKLRLLGNEKAAVLKRYTDDSEAYQLYLKGRFHLHKHTPEGWLTAMQFFREAIALEPQYAAAHAQLSSVLAISIFLGVLPHSTSIDEWRSSTQRALEIDPDLAEAHLAMGGLQIYHEWNLPRAEEAYLRSIALDPEGADAHHQLAMLLVAQGRSAEAFEHAQRALALDPLSPLVNIHVVWALLFAGRFDEALGHLQQMLALAPHVDAVHWQLGVVHGARGEYDLAIEALKRALALGGNPNILASLGTIYGQMGRIDEARSVAGHLLELRGVHTVTAFNIARVYAGMGECDLAFEWLDRAVAERDAELVLLEREVDTGSGSIFGPAVRGDRRYTRILERIRPEQ